MYTWRVFCACVRVRVRVRVRACVRACLRVVFVDTRLIDCGDLKTKARVSFIVQATLRGSKTKH